jgi:hypothetical protein
MNRPTTKVSNMVEKRRERMDRLILAPSIQKKGNWRLDLEVMTGLTREN